ncbi:MAG: methyl-accepting chemotaxis protein [Treponema sp.]|jgi:methyl-accepting chemotaxis protein|nr:methyl-accepting chemotaxis protein [Treponema sp.]
MALFRNLFQKNIPQQQVARQENTVPGVPVSPEAMKTILKSSEHLALSILHGIKTLSEVITYAHLQDAELVHFDAFLKETNKAFAEISSITENMQRFADTQTNVIAQSVSSIEQLSSSITSISNDIVKRLAITKGLSEAAIDGNDKVKKVLDVVKVLSENMESIKTVISSINAISAQTNMLAMNAAIEAAHAGQAGRGFSVVADEIRQLSEVTRRNAITITETVKNTMIALDEVRSTVNKASGAMLWIEEEVTKASSSFDAITQNLQKLESDGAGMTQTIQKIDVSGLGFKEKSAEAQSSLTEISKTLEHLVLTEQNIKEHSAIIVKAAVHITDYFQNAISNEGALQNALDATLNKTASFEQKDPFPFTAVVLKHLNWLVRVRGLLDGTLKSLDIDSNHHTCDLGKWIDGQKGKPYASLPAFEDLDSVHEKLHNLVKDIVSQYHKLPPEELEEKYALLLNVSKQVIEALIKLRGSIR